MFICSLHLTSVCSSKEWIWCTGALSHQNKQTCESRCFCQILLSPISISRVYGLMIQIPNTQCMTYLQHLHLVNFDGKCRLNWVSRSICFSMSHHQQVGVSIDISLLVQRFTRLSNEQFVHDKFTFESFLWLPWSILNDQQKQSFCFQFFWVIICYVLKCIKCSWNNLHHT